MIIRIIEKYFFKIRFFYLINYIGFSAKIKPRLNISISDFNNSISLSPLKIIIFISYIIILTQLTFFYIFTISIIISYSNLYSNNTLFLYFDIIIIITRLFIRDLFIIITIKSLNLLTSNF